MSMKKKHDIKNSLLAKVYRSDDSASHLLSDGQEREPGCQWRHGKDMRRFFHHVDFAFAVKGARGVQGLNEMKAKG